MNKADMCTVPLSAVMARNVKYPMHRVNKLIIVLNINETIVIAVSTETIIKLALSSVETIYEAEWERCARKARDRAGVI